ncbi:MAG: pentapeptide repeat-containing protein [Prochloraceae cyanobacterium]
MTNWQHLVMIKKGVNAWNEWRQKYPAIRPDLSNSFLNGASLRGANLRWADLSGASLIKADLRWANLRKADLRGANLSGASLRAACLTKASLKGASFNETDLSQIRAVGTKFIGSILTGACLEDWSINSETILDDVICDYVYLKAKQQERFPSIGNFAPGEFSQLFQKSQGPTERILYKNVEREEEHISSDVVDSFNDDYIQDVTEEVEIFDQSPYFFKDQSEIKDLLSKLQKLIVVSEDLKDRDKDKALELVTTLANTLQSF